MAAKRAAGKDAGPADLEVQEATAEGGLLPLTKANIEFNAVLTMIQKRKPSSAATPFIRSATFKNVA